MVAPSSVPEIADAHDYQTIPEEDEGQEDNKDVITDTMMNNQLVDDGTKNMRTG